MQLLLVDAFVHTLYHVPRLKRKTVGLEKPLLPARNDGVAFFHLFGDKQVAYLPWN